MRYLCGLLFLCSVHVTAYDNHPSPELGPLDVLEIILSGLASNDFPERDAGLQQTFRFASPANKAIVGPYWHFKAVVKQPQYAPLINHVQRTIGEPVTNDNTLTVPLFVTSSSGDIAAFMWILSLQIGGSHDGSWMTDGVRRVEIGKDLRSL